jgi:D-arabinose 1-dehydrogenase-like Zn-dependent alcohol dehydrogenase
MRAMVLEGFGKPLVRTEVPEPTLGPREALVRSRANGLCATDLKIVDGLVKSVKVPLPLGHESAGVVGEVGPEVEAVRPGDRVVVVCKQTCGPAIRWAGSSSPGEPRHGGPDRGAPTGPA